MPLACALDSAQGNGLPVCSSSSRKTQCLCSTGKRQLVLKTLISFFFRCVC